MSFLTFLQADRGFVALLRELLPRGILERVSEGALQLEERDVEARAEGGSRKPAGRRWGTQTEPVKALGNQIFATYGVLLTIDTLDNGPNAQETLGKTRE